MDPLSLIVTALASGAAAGIGESTSAAVKDASEVLRARLKQRFAGDRHAEDTLEAHAEDPDTWDSALRQQLQRYHADQDPTVVAAAQQVLQLTDARRNDARTYTVKVDGRGRASVGDQTEVRDARVGGNINIDKRRSRTTIALGGGVLIALALMFVWYQYAANKARADELSAYQQSVLATCQRIQDTGTFKLIFHPSDNGFDVYRKDLLRQIERGAAVRDEQIAALLERSSPAELDDERTAVRHAHEELQQTEPAALDEIRHWPRKMSIEDYQDRATAEPVANFSDAYRRLGDSLTRLAGSTCSIEAKE